MSALKNVKIAVDSIRFPNEAGDSMQSVRPTFISSISNESNTRKTSYKVSFQPNYTNERTVTRCTTRPEPKPPMALFTKQFMENSRKRKALSENQAEQPAQKRSKCITPPNDEASSSIIYVSESSNDSVTNDDSVIFVSDSRAEAEVDENDRAIAFGNYKRHFAVKHGKIQKRQRRRRYPKKVQAAIRGEFNSRTELSHFTPNAVIETSPLNDIKLNPCALARSIEEPEPMSYEDEEKLFKKSPELFEKRMIIIDGSNVARCFEHTNRVFSVKGIEACLQHFEEKGFIAKAIIPRWRMKKNVSTDPAGLDRLHNAGKLYLSPCKNLPGNRSTCYDDRFILEAAEKFNGAIVSNDDFRDLIGENPRWDKIILERVVGFLCYEGIFILPRDPYGRRGRTLDTILHKRKPIIRCNGGSPGLFDSTIF